MSSSDSSFSSSFSSSAGAASAAPPAAAPPEAAAPPPPPPPDGTEASLAEPSEMSCEVLVGHSAQRLRDKAYLVDVLALQLTDELVQALGISLDTDGLEDFLYAVSMAHAHIQCDRSHLDVAGGGRGVATEAEEKVCREVLHCDGCLGSCSRNRSSIDLTCCYQYIRIQLSREACVPC
jgi:hypothetical protein